MKNEAITHTKSPEIQETSLDDLFERMSQWSDRIGRRAYELFASSGFTNGHDQEDWFRAEQELLKPVAVEVKDTKNEFIVIAEVPGFDVKDLDIHLNGYHLTIEGRRETEERKEKEGETIYSERKSQHIYRTVALPAPILADQAEAELSNGVLELRLPKAEAPKKTRSAAA